MPNMDAILAHTAHRPWPLPSAPWVMFQSWQRLLFAHWAIPQATLRALVPEPLELDSYHGATYIGVVPFDLRGLRFRFLPPLPLVSSFPEANVRTYVRYGGKAGVFFFSLDAASRLAVLGARASFELPYVAAEMNIVQRGDWIEYRSRRPGATADAELMVRYRSTGARFTASPDSLEYFLTARYALYVVRGNGTVMRGDIHHAPWELQPAAAEIEKNTLASASNILLPATPPILHYAERQDTLFWVPSPAAYLVAR